MSIVEIREAQQFHCGQMARRMRREHRELILKAGIDPHRELLARWRSSIVRQVAYLDGQLAAMWGMTSQHLSDIGFVWLVLTEEAAARPIRVIRYARRGIAEFAATKTELETQILLDDPGSIRLAAMLGFHLTDLGDGAPAHDREGRARLIAAAEDHIGRQGTFKGLRFAMLGYHPIAPAREEAA